MLAAVGGEANRAATHTNQDREIEEMETPLHEAMTSGVLVDVRDADGNSVAQAVYFDWRGRPVPAVGDSMSCDGFSLSDGRPQRIVGRVRERQFDVQMDELGEVCVWVRVVLVMHEAPRAAKLGRMAFSAN